MIEARVKTVWFSSEKGQHYQSLRAACKAEAHAIIYALYPRERSESDGNGSCYYPGYDLAYDDPKKFARLEKRFMSRAKRLFLQRTSIH